MEGEKGERDRERERRGIGKGEFERWLMYNI